MFLVCGAVYQRGRVPWRQQAGYINLNFTLNIFNLLLKSSLADLNKLSFYLKRYFENIYIIFKTEKFNGKFWRKKVTLTEGPVSP